MWMSCLLVLLSTGAFLKWIYLLKVIMIVIMSTAFIVAHEMVAPHTVSEVYKDLNFVGSANESQLLIQER